jgi:hypothetical protein
MAAAANDTKFSEKNFAINQEKDQALSSDHVLYPALVDALPGVATGPIIVGDRKVWIVLVSRSGGEVQPYHSVRDACARQLRAQRARQYHDRLRQNQRRTQ